jgi:hypothetical protein
MIGLKRLPLADSTGQHPRYWIKTISLDLRILNTAPHLQTVVTPSGFRNILRSSSVICAQNDLFALITFALIFALTPTSSHTCVQCAGKPLRANTIESVMKGFIPERRSSFAKESLKKAASGDVAAGLPVLMHWGGISAHKRAGSASSRCLTKKPLNDSVCGRSNVYKTCICNSHSQ